MAICIKIKKSKSCFAFIFIIAINVLILFQLKTTILNTAFYANIVLKHKSSPIAPATFKKDKWIVVTTINQPTDQIVRLSKIPNFQLLVVGDLKTPSNWSYENVIYLSIEKQKQLGYRSFDTTPFNAYTRKNIGYLYAIQHGAKYIYDTDDDNAPIVDINQYFQTKNTTYGLTFPTCNNITVINPNSHFGQPHLWPRGYPLNEINKIHDNEYICKLLKTSSVQQGLVNGDPDVDAIYRLTNSIKNQPIQLEFDSTAPSIQLPIARLSPYNSQNTFFHYRAFWSLYLPSTVTFRLTDIWRSYWSQRLLWLIGDTLTFHGPNAVQIRNVHSYIKDFAEEMDMYEQTDSLVEFLLNWKCDIKDFDDCIIKLTENMIENEFLKTEELDGMRNWIDDLKEIGYLQPEIVNEFRSIKRNECSFNNMDTEQFSLRFSPNIQANAQNLLTRSKFNISMIDYEKHINERILKNYCKGHLNMNEENNKTKNGSESTHDSYDIVLLITFNHDPKNYLGNIILLNQMYLKYFKHVVFCGANLSSYLNDYKHKNNKIHDEFTFIEFDSQQGYNHYYCMKKAIDIGFHNTVSILLVSDDFLFKPWNFAGLDHSKIWFADYGSCHSYDKNFSEIKHLKFFNSAYGHEAILRTWKSFENNNSPILKNYINVLEENFNSTRIVCKKLSDGFYLPKSKFEAFQYIAQLFYKQQVFLEYAVPMILYGLDNINNILILHGAYYAYKNKSIKLYDTIIHYVHPAKLTLLTKDLRWFCNLIIKDLLLN